MFTNKLIKPSLASAILMLMASIHVLLIWPGFLSPDSQTQYMMAIAGIYNDHHPPLMAFVWRYLDRLYTGCGMMLLLHLALFYGAIFYLIKSVRSYSSKYLLLFLPIIPQIFLYSIMIWKDVGFTYCFLFVASYLTYLTANKQQLSWEKISLLLLILLYGTAIKFQAKYCAPIILAHMAYILSNYQLCYKKIIKIYGLLLIGFYLCLNNINWILIPKVEKSHAWQLVKIYDLAAISLSTSNDLFPEFTKNKNFSMQEMFNRLNRHPLDRSKYYMVDDLIFGDAILKTGSNPKERKELYFAWVTAIVKHPLEYLKHRGINMASMLLYHPAFKYIDPLINQNSFLSFTVNTLIYLTMSNLIPAILCFIYLIYGIYLFKKMNNINSYNWFAIPLMCFNSIGITMLLVLFFCSMAGTPRYTYITVCMAHASHIFAYLAYKKAINQPDPLAYLNKNLAHTAH